MSVGFAAPVRRVRATWARADTVLGTRRRLIAPLSVLSIFAGLFEAGVLAITAEVAFAMAQSESSTDVALGPLSVDARVPQLLGIAVVLAILRIGVQWLLARLTARMYASAQSSLQRQLFHTYSNAAWSVQSAKGEGQPPGADDVARQGGGHPWCHDRRGAISPFASFVILVGSAVVLSPVIALAVAVVAVGSSCSSAPWVG